MAAGLRGDLGFWHRALPPRHGQPRHPAVLRSQPPSVEGCVVQPAYRQTPWDAEAQQRMAQRDKARIAFVSESGICRAPLAAAAFSRLLQDSPLAGCVEVVARATRDYCLGEPPHPAAAQLMAQLMAPAETAQGGAALFQPAADIVASDLVLVMDKFTAADVLREVSSFDLMQADGHYCCRVRLLGACIPRLAAAAASATAASDAADLDDPLYGNIGGPVEEAAVAQVADLIQEACACLLAQLEAIADAAGCLHGASSSGSEAGSSGDGSSSSSSSSSSQAGSRGAAFRAALVQHVRAEGVIDWLKPPMLQGASTDLGGWV